MTQFMICDSRADAEDRVKREGFAFGRLALETNVNNLVDQCYTAALAAGWYHSPHTGEAKEMNFGERIALKHSELSEALEADRKGLMSDHIPEFTGVEEEFADILIRIFDTAGAMKLRLGKALVAKLIYNATREDHKPENRAKEGGKEY